MIKVKVNGKSEYSVLTSGEGQGEINGEAFKLDQIPVKPGTWHVLYKGGSYTVDMVKHDPETKSMTVLVNGTRYNLEMRDKYDELLSSLGMNLGAKAIRELKAPMPGMVLQVMVSNGESVTKDQPLLILEAMKMENVLKAPGDAVIKTINISQGNAVEKNQVLISFE